MKGKITKRRIDALQPDKDSDVFLWDTELAGFGARIKPSGAGAFLISYYAPGLNNVRRRLTIGPFGTITVDEARKKAKRLLARVVNGDDPALEQTSERRASKNERVGQMFGLYLEEGIARRKPRTLEFYESLGRLYIIPAIGQLPVAKVVHRDVAALHTKLREKPVTANRVGRLVRSFYYWLIKRGNVVGENPAKNLDWYPESERERIFSDDDKARLGEAMRIAATVGLPPAPKNKKPAGTKRERNAGMFKSEVKPASPFTIGAIRFLVLTGWREQEALTLKWADINFDNGLVRLPDTKTGKSDRSLGAPALLLLSELPQIEGSPYVFPGRNPQRPLREIQRVWNAVRHHAGLSDARLHDLRHSVASFAVERGFDTFLVSKLLGHKSPRSTERYMHLSKDARRSMADAVSGGMSIALEAKPKRPVRKFNARG